MPSLFGKSHLYRYDIQGAGKRHYLVFIHLPCLFTHFKHLHSHLSLFPYHQNSQTIIECLMNEQSLTRDCLEYIFQRLQIRDRTIFHCFGLSYFNKTNQQSYWLDPDLPMRQQLPKTEIKPNLTFTFLLYPSLPHTIVDDKARMILHEQLFCNFISSVYTVSASSAACLSAYFIRGCFPGEFHRENNADLLQVILNAIGHSDEIQEKIIEIYRSMNEIDPTSAQKHFIQQISQLNTYGMIHLECKNTLNETICLGLNHQGLHSRSLIHQNFKLETGWPTVSSISSNKRRQINLLVKPTNDHLRTLIYYTDSTNYNRYCFRLLQLFSNHFRSVSTAKLTRIPSFDLGVSVPDLRSDGETSSNDQTPPSGSSSTRSSSQSAHPWTGSLPNLTVQLSIDSTKKDISRTKNDPYATYADNLNRIDEHETLESTNAKDILSRRSLPASHQNTSAMSNQDSVRSSPSNASTVTSHSRSLLNSRTFLSSTSVPLEAETISVHDDATVDTWLADFESKVSSNSVYDEFDSIPISRLNSSTEDGRLPENTRRNRYTDVIPYDDTRVRLIPNKENLHGYINASHVKIRVENTIYSYIAAESPLPSTVHDFWRMISGSNIHVIVMLLPNDPQLCANYFPRYKTEKCRTDEFEIELMSEQNRDVYHIRHLKMRFLNGQRTRTLVHLQYTAWDDSQLPLDSLKFIDFINVANTFQRHYGETNPCLVHCTAGIGRTGVFILIHVMIQCITFNKKVSVASVLKVMREHRMSLVDRTYSYVFVYRCLIDYLKSSRLI